MRLDPLLCERTNDQATFLGMFWGGFILPNKPEVGLWELQFANNKFEIEESSRDFEFLLTIYISTTKCYHLQSLRPVVSWKQAWGFGFVHSLWFLSVPHAMCVFSLKKYQISRSHIELEFSCPARMQTEDAREPNKCTIHICRSMQFDVASPVLT